MKKLLVLTDFSDDSVNAYRYAVQLACQIKANILLVFSSNGKTISLTSKTQYSQVLNSFAKRYACNTHAKNNSHPTECLISEEEWTTAIPNIIAAHKPDLVVAGSGLLTQFEKEQAAITLQDFAHCPILWIPEKATYKPLQNLVFVTDFTDQEPAVNERVKAFAQEFKANITLVHFYAKTDRSHLAEIKKQGIELRKFMAETATDSFLIEEEDMIEGLEDFAEKNPVDLFLLATRDTHLAHHYFQPVYRKTNTCQIAIPFLNLYQEKLKPCAGSCLFCHEPEAKEMKLKA